MATLNLFRLFQKTKVGFCWRVNRITWVKTLGYVGSTCSHVDCWWQWQVVPISSEKLRWPCFGVVLAGRFFFPSLSSWSHRLWFESTLFGVFVQMIPFIKIGLKHLVTDAKSFARHLWHQVCCTWVGLRYIASLSSFQLVRISVFFDVFSFLRGFFWLKMPNVLFCRSKIIIDLASARMICYPVGRSVGDPNEKRNWLRVGLSSRSYYPVEHV